MFKNFLQKKIFLTLFSTFVVASFFAPSVFAVWNGTFYAPGETLDPECLPTDVDCDVLPPVTTADKLSALASTTSAELAGVVSDETGTGSAVFATSPTFGTSINGSYLTASTILISDGSKNIISADTATYPSLTEFSYVKGVTSAIQTQLNSKLSSITGSDTQVTFFDGANNPAGDAGLTYNKTTDALTLAGNLVSSKTGSSFTISNTGNTLSNIAITSGGTTILNGESNMSIGMTALGNVYMHSYGPNTYRYHTFSTQYANKSTSAINTSFTLTTNAGASSAGFGTGLTFRGETSAATAYDYDMARVAGVWNDSTHLSQTGALSFATVNSGAALTEIAKLSKTGLRVGDGSNATAQLDVQNVNGSTTKTLLINNGSATGNIFEAQDNGTARWTIEDGGNLKFFSTGTGNPVIFQVSSNAATGTDNLVAGAGAGAALTSGFQNTFIGTGAGANTNGFLYNTALGYRAFYSATGANNNTAIGHQAGYNVTNGHENTFLGGNAGYYVNSGRDNTLLGYATGWSITTGDYNTIVGANVTGLSSSLSNNIILADGQGNKRIVVDSAGTVGIGAGLGTTITGTAKGLLVNNGTSTGNIFEAQDNGTAVFTVADGGAVTASGTTTLDNAVLGQMDFEADSGIISWADMSVSSTPADNTVESYTAGLDGNAMITVYGQADGAGATDTLGVGIRNTTPTATLHVSGTTGTQKTFIANNNTSTGNIIEAQDGGVSVFSVADGGATTIGGSSLGISVVPLTLQLGTSSTAKILDMKNSVGTTIMSISSGGNIVWPQGTGSPSLQADEPAGILTLRVGGATNNSTLILNANTGDTTLSSYAQKNKYTLSYAASSTSTINSSHIFDTNPGNTSAGFGTGLLLRGQSSTTAGQDMVRLSGVWTTATHASRTSAFTFDTVNNGGSLEEIARLSKGQLILGVDVNGSAVDQMLKAHDGITGTDISGANLTIAAGRGTGAGSGGSIIFQTAPVLATGTTAQTLVTAMTIGKSGLVTVDDLTLGAMSFDADAGIVSWADMPVTSSAAINTVESYVAQLDGNPMLSIYGVSDGAGSVKSASLGVGIGTTSPLRRLDVAGSARVTGTATSVLTGSINPTASTAVVGVGTLFTTELVVGDRITVSAETRTVTAITDDTHLTVDTATTDTANDTSPDKLNAVFIARDSSNNVKMLINDLGTMSIGGVTATRSTTQPTNALDIYDGTAPAGTLANGITLYSTAGELRVMDAAGNATLLSPHENVNNYWVFDSVNAVTGQTLLIDMELMMKRLNSTFGWDFVHQTLNGLEISDDATPLELPDTFMGAVFSKVSTWLASATNGITNIFAGEVETKSLCVADTAGAKTCITKDQLDALILNAGISTPPPAPAPEPAPEPTPEPAPEPVPEPDSTGSPQADPTCSDGIQNQDETGIDTGGVCTPAEPLVPSGPVEGEPVPEPTI